MERKPICRVLTGPTASGKSDLAFRMAKAHGWEIICMDSMQIYRGMDIGTAKPTKAEQKAVPHHLLDICDPQETYSVSSYVKDAEKTVKEIASRFGFSEAKVKSMLLRSRRKLKTVLEKEGYL